MTYDPSDNARKCYDVAIEACRDKLNSFRKEVIGECVLYHGDCRELLPLLPKVDAVVTDPPYGISADKGAAAGGRGGFYAKRTGVNRYDGDWDGERPASATFARILEAARVHIIWGGNYFTDALPVSRKWLFWDKCQTMPTYSDGEMAWTSLDGVATKRLVYSNNGLMAREKDRVHPTQKPVEVMRWCIRMTEGTVLDPFMGSGTTGVACVKLGRKFIGIEIETKYFDIACKRISDAYKQPDMFVEAPAPKPEQLSLMESSP
jgi:DNA modification methylase